MRIRLTFSKTTSMRFTGHLDLHTTLERTLRRAGIPVTYSKGFNPRPRLQLASALPLGFTSDCELADIWLDRWISPPEIKAALQASLPSGIVVHTVEEIPLESPKLQHLIHAASFNIDLLDLVPDLDERVAALLKAAALPRERRRKTYDLRPLILKLIVVKDASGGQRLKMTLRAQEGATGRADEVAAALGIDPAAARFHRVGIHLQQPA